MSFDVSRPSQDGHLPRPADTAAGRELKDPSTGDSGLSDDLSRHLEAALYGPVGIDKLLNRLKQSIYSAREFSSFLKERSALEDRHAQGYKKLVRNASETIRRPEARQGSYARCLDESLRINDRIAENGLQFANALQTMSEELRDMADNAEKGRKHWKHTAMDAEKKVTDAEHAQQKARDRYNNASEQYERVRTGEKQGGKFGLKNKTPAQQEEALKEKADMLDQEYAVKTQAAQAERRDFESTHKPQIVRALRDLISECDAALAMQVAKLASISEKHVVSNGMAIAPIKSPEAAGPQPRGLRLIASEMDDRKDFQDYMLDGTEPPPAFKGRSRRNTDVDFANAPKPSTQNVERQATFDSPYTENKKPVEPELPQLPQIGGQDTFISGFETPRPGMQNQNSYSAGTTEVLHVPYSTQSQQTGGTQERAPSLPADRDTGGPQMPPFDRAQAPTGPYNGAPSFDRNHGPQRQDTNGVPPLPTSPGPQRQDTMGSGGAGSGPGLQASAPGPYLGRGGPAPGSYMDPGKNAGPYGAGRGQNVPATRTLPSQQPPRPALPPLKPVFGVHLDELFRRDGSAVPAIVFHCIQAVDTFGLHTEGIYRVPGSTPTVMQLKSEFDHDSSKVNLSDPETFNNDISAVATLLKNFLRDLPDPLLTTAAYHSFIQAAKYEDTIMRRDALHQFINSLPDPNYATLRVLILHLHRVAMNSDANKMDMRNLAIVFGPTVMGGAHVTDARWQTNVMETILQHTHDIFDPDE